jgi:phage tail P2-like protein
MASLLPANASSLEKNIVASFSDVVDDKDLLLKKLYNVDECPKELLVYLAWFFNVDFSIYNQLKEPAQREYIKQSINIHRKKGTLRALRDALKLDGYDINIVEWYQNNKQPHTAQIKLSTSNNDFDLNFVRKIVSKNKNVQTILNYLFNTSSKEDLYIGLACKVRLKYKIDSNIGEYIQMLEDLINEVNNG